MAQQVFDVGASARIVVEGCHGDLRVEGGDRTQVEINGDRHLATRVSQSDGEVRIRGHHGDLMLRVGREATIIARRVSGDCQIDQVASLEVKSLAGDLMATNIRTVHAGAVAGDLQVNGATEVHAASVGGDLRADLQGGSVTVDRVGGDLELINAASARVGKVGGDAAINGVAELQGLDTVGGDLHLQWGGRLAEPIATAVGGDVRLELTEDGAFVLRAVSGGEISGDGTTWDIRTERSTGAASGGEQNPGEPADQEQPDTAQARTEQGWTMQEAGGSVAATFGDGGHELRLSVGGDLEVRGGRVTAYSYTSAEDVQAHIGELGIGGEMRKLARDLKRMAKDLAREVEQEVRTATRGPGPGPRPRFGFHFNDRAFNFDPEQIERITREAREAAQSGIARAQEAVERALVNMVATRGEPGRPPRPPRPARPGFGPRPPVTPRPPVPSYTGQTVRIERESPPAPPARSPEEIQSEKLAILRMVSEGRLSIDEAETMLRALEGRG